MPDYIKKISIKTVESFIGKKLKINKISIGFDVAQYNTGIAIIKTTDAYLTLELTKTIKTPKLPKKYNTKEILRNISIFIDQLESFKAEIVQKYRIDINRIEDCFFGRNVKTLKALARYGVLVYDRFRGISKDIDFILPNSARSKIKFKKSKKATGDKLKKEIIDYINAMLGTEIDDTDIADGIVLSLAGLIGE